MPRANPLQPSFNAGELSPRMTSRVDFSQYDNAVEVMENLIPLPQGGATRRPGTRYIADAQSHAVKPRLIPFVFSTVQAYVLEAGDAVMRFFRDGGAITVADTDATITNGSFDSGITDWDDRSTGAAAIAHEIVEANAEGTFQNAQTGSGGIGDGLAGGKNFGLRFTNTVAGDVAQARLNVASVTTAYNAHAGIYTDNAGSPGTQVGGDSNTVGLTTTGDKTFTWGTKPTLAADTNYWLVFTDESTVGVVDIGICNDQGTPFLSGFSDTITSIADQLSAGNEWRFEILVEGPSSTGVLALQGASGGIAWAEQDVTVGGGFLNQEHVLRFRARGAASDTVALRIGSTSTGRDIVDDLALGVGYHAIAFTPTASPVYIQFRNSAAKTLHIDDVALLDNQPVELVTPYAEATLPSLKWAQTADVLYIVAGGTTPVQKLERRGHASWSMVEVNFVDGPYLGENGTSTTLTPSASSGLGVTLTASADLFATTDVGRLLRYKSASAYGYAVITAFTDTQNVTIDILRNFDGTSASTTWSLGAWSATTGYPSAIGFFEQRSVFAGTTTQPQTFWLSQSADLENMRPDSDAGAVEADDAIDFTFAADQVNAIRWISPGTEMIVGTIGGEWSVSSSGAVLTPSDIRARRHTTMGSADIQPVRARARLLMVQRALRKLLEFVFNFQVDGFEALDLTLLSDHVTRTGVADLVYQQEPDSTIWALRNDGSLATLAYQPDQQVVGWSRQEVGGAFGGARAVVETVATIPAGERDELWLVVKRTIDGATKRYVELLEAPYQRSVTAEVDAFYVDGGLSLDQRNSDAAKTLMLTSAAADSWTQGASGTLTATGHSPFTAGDVGDLWGLWAEGAVAWVTINAFTSASVVDVDFAVTVPRPLRARATASWLDPDARVSAVSGLDHLEGETVHILCDGASHAPQTVASGAVTLDRPGGIVHVGLPYTWTLRSLKLAVGARGGTAVAKPKRVHAVSLILVDSLGVAAGPSVDDLTPVDFRVVADPMDIGTPLFTGERRIALDGAWSRDPRIVLQGSDPVPFTLLALAPELLTNEML